MKRERERRERYIIRLLLSILSFHRQFFLSKERYMQFKYRLGGVRQLAQAHLQGEKIRHRNPERERQRDRETNNERQAVRERGRERETHTHTHRLKATERDGRGQGSI